MNASASNDQKFRDEITRDFKEGRVGIENGWLVEYHASCPNPCAGIEYGCPPSCSMTPLIDLASFGISWDEPEVTADTIPAPLTEGVGQCLPF